ncbi:flagellar filament capping protein FliD [Paenibacillus alginolyticus]|uniref:flagellar filament capping protein FliD n=1 Tax=Paenibacillus alginolyticus TaxID=59839 RepID=UPI0003F85741|nr:flagellar filament capping protein FliD [Paenibacillus alginolyticus]MCY9665097.1 flagellar filament capping protein FliD [Paenibacillus alginolyticus]
MTTRINGLGSSGLDIDTLVSQMMQAKRVPIDQMTQKMTVLGWQRDAYRNMNTDMSSFMTEAQKLTLQSTFLAKKVSLSASDTDKVQVTPAANALTGNFTLQVKQLAKNATITSSAALGISANSSNPLAVADATLKITGSVGSDSVNILNGDNISQIVSKINAKTTTTGVKANYDQLTDKLTLVNAQTGAAGNTLQVIDQSNTNILRDKLNLSDTTTPNANSTPDLATSAQTNVFKGQDALVNFNGTGDVSVKSNSFMLNNFSFTLLADPGATPYTINGSNNSNVDQVVTTIKGFFDKYNTLIDKVNAKLIEPKYRDYTPLTDTQKTNMKDSDITLWNSKAQSGLLQNDSILSTGLDAMRSDLSNNVSGIAAGQYMNLADIGITTAVAGSGSAILASQEKGKIYIDENKLRTALTNSPDQVAALFTKDGTRGANGLLTNSSDAGIGTRLYEHIKVNIVNQLTQKTQVVPSKSYLNQQIDNYTTQISTAQSGLNDYEQQLYSKFSTMQTALNKLNSQGTQLSSYFK